MNKEEYLQRLETRSKKYNIENIYSVLHDYEIIINDILEVKNDMEAVCEQLGFPEIVADEYAMEFNYTLINKKAVYSTKYRSNTSLNIFKIILMFMQMALTLALMIMLVLSFWVGFDSQIKYNIQKEQAVIAVCQNNDCLGLVNYQDENFQENICNSYTECFGTSQNIETTKIAIFYPLLIASISIIFLIFCIYLLGIRNINKAIKTNNEYNRKRKVTYE